MGEREMGEREGDRWGRERERDGGEMVGLGHAGHRVQCAGAGGERWEREREIEEMEEGEGARWESRGEGREIGESHAVACGHAALTRP